MVAKSFGECTLAWLTKTFKLKRLLKSPDLESWLNTPSSLTAREKDSLADLQEDLQFNILGWNEQELAMHFIGPVLSLAKLYSPQFNLFAERYIEATVDDIKLSGRPDELVATGYFEPEKPFFCFHEYKKQIDNSGDPIGQVLSAMLAGQSLNDNQSLLYGCYVVGRDWYFITLRDRQYCISKGHNVMNTDDLHYIFQVLKHLKLIVIKLTTE
jgi:hypothetical protein